MQLFGHKIKFGRPTKADVIIFDSTNSNLLLNVIEKSDSVYIYNCRPPEIWFGISLVPILFKTLFSHSIQSNLKHPRGKIFGLLKFIYYLYIESILISINPKYIITYIDNSGLFGWLSKNCKRFPFISVQNGGRLSYVASDTSNYYSQHLFCFGRHEVNLFPKLGYQVEKYYPSGSLSASLYLNHENEKFRTKYDLFIISTWRGNIGFPKDVENTMRSMKIMDELLVKYIRTRKIKAAVILRAEVNSEHWFIPELGMNEADYYQSIYGNDLEVINNDFSKRPIYGLMEQSRMIISCLSTALLEGFGIGKKALYYNFCGTNEYHKDFDAGIVSTKSEESEFNEELDKILSMSEEDYKGQYRHLQEYYMNFPKDKPTFKFISDKINEIVAQAN